MTKWLQDDPAQLCQRLRSVAINGDLRRVQVADEARALMHAAREVICREVLNMPMNDMAYSQRNACAPLHWSWGDRFRDALSCLAGRARVLRRDICE